MSAYAMMLNTINEISKARGYLGMSNSEKIMYNIYKLSPKPAQGRNEKCNCGSGLKFKKCCGKEV